MTLGQIHRAFSAGHLTAQQAAAMAHEIMERERAAIGRKILLNEEHHEPILTPRERLVWRCIVVVAGASIIGAAYILITWSLTWKGLP